MNTIFANVFGFSLDHRISPACWPSASRAEASNFVVAVQLPSAGAGLSRTFFAVAVPPSMSPARTASESRPPPTLIAVSSRRRTSQSGDSALPLNSSDTGVSHRSTSWIENVTALMPSRLPAKSVDRYVDDVVRRLRDGERPGVLLERCRR